MWEAEVNGLNVHHVFMMWALKRFHTNRLGLLFMSTTSTSCSTLVGLFRCLVYKEIPERFAVLLHNKCCSHPAPWRLSLYLFLCVTVLLHSLHSYYIGLHLRRHPHQPGEGGRQLHMGEEQDRGQVSQVCTSTQTPGRESHRH